MKISPAQRIDDRSLVRVLAAINKIAIMKDQGVWPRSANRHEIDRAIDAYEHLLGCQSFAELLDRLGIDLCDR
jgi:hypothetical protein